MDSMEFPVFFGECWVPSPVVRWFEPSVLSSGAEELDLERCVAAARREAIELEGPCLPQECLGWGFPQMGVPQ